MAMSNGKRRIDRILAPSYAEGLEELSLDEVKNRRDESLAEREYQSLLRRLVQGRLDILRAYLEKRAPGNGAATAASGDQALVAELAQALASSAGSRRSRGEALRLLVPPDEMHLARRRVEKLLADPSISDPRALSDQELTDAVARLESEEKLVSADRTAVIRVHDRLQSELRRRYRQDPSLALS